MALGLRSSWCCSPASWAALVSGGPTEVRKQCSWRAVVRCLPRLGTVSYTHLDVYKRQALHQSRDVIFDCRRMKGAREEAVLKEVRKWAGSLASVRRLLFVDRSGGVLRIK